jgi:hypothetical protein
MDSLTYFIVSVGSLIAIAVAGMLSIETLFYVY